MWKLDYESQALFLASLLIVGAQVSAFRESKVAEVEVRLVLPFH